DGARYWARSVLTALHDPEGRLRGFAKVVQDLSERRHVEELEQTARNVSNFIAMLAHELRNPLAPIRSAVEVLRRIGGGGEPARDSMVATIDRQSGQLARIVDDLLDISRIAHGKISIRREPVDLAEAARRAVETAG